MRYPMSESKLALSGEQRAAAEALMAERPECYPNTRVCKDRAAQLVWFDKVRAEGKRLGVPDNKWQQFCDVAGVAD